MSVVRNLEFCVSVFKCGLALNHLSPKNEVQRINIGDVDHVIYLCHLCHVSAAYVLCCEEFAVPGVCMSVTLMSSFVPGLRCIESEMWVINLCDFLFHLCIVISYSSLL